MHTTMTDLPPVLRPTDVAQLVRAQTTVRLLDVRTPGEYETVHISGAYNAPLDTIGEHAREIHENVIGLGRAPVTFASAPRTCAS